VLCAAATFVVISPCFFVDDEDITVTVTLHQYTVMLLKLLVPASWDNSSHHKKLYECSAANVISWSADIPLPARHHDSSTSISSSESSRARQTSITLETGENLSKTAATLLEKIQ
jgi:hypothetical protein